MMRPTQYLLYSHLMLKLEVIFMEKLNRYFFFFFLITKNEKILMVN